MSGSRRPSQKPTATAIVTRSACRKLGEPMFRFEKISSGDIRRFCRKRVSALSIFSSVRCASALPDRLRRILSMRRVALQIRRNVASTAAYASGWVAANCFLRISSISYSIARNSAFTLMRECGSRFSSTAKPISSRSAEALRIRSR
ncbi:hypothetical protein DM47_4789 [Burkholderia mallei]|nr:hypothetical protein DM49_4849 [Burkholderia mallei]KOT15912.1 hypothetical protein DM47_4789 [Burkholderia mallei]